MPVHLAVVVEFSCGPAPEGNRDAGGCWWFHLLPARGRDGCGRESLIKPPGPVTIRSLLNHRSGMPNYWEPPTDIASRRFTHQERLGFAAATPRMRSRRPLFSYSNTNYSALAILVEKLRCQDIGAVIEADNVKPLGLKDTLMSGVDPKPQRTIHGYTVQDGTQSDNTLAPLHCSNNAYFGHVGVVRGYAALALISEDGSRQVAMAVARAPVPDPVSFDDPQSLEMAEAAVKALNLAC